MGKFVIVLYCYSVLLSIGIDLFPVVHFKFCVVHCSTEEYVTCHTCRSPDTILQKETRLFFIQCETCGSRKSVASIKSGFQAITQKRAQLKSKQQ